MDVYCHWAVVSEITRFNTRSWVSRWLRRLFSKHPDDGDLFLNMIHFTGTIQANVAVQDIRSYNRKLRVNNSKDRDKEMLSPHQIRRNIYSLSEDPSLSGEYSLLTNNCEDIANYIRYGKRESDQIVLCKACTSGVLFRLLLVAFILALVFIGMMACLIYFYRIFK